MKKILMTGFEPFGGESSNPSWEAVSQLDQSLIAGSHRIIGLQLPCEFEASLSVLNEALNALQPEIVIAVGQAGGRCDLSVERVAINLIDARIADNAGAQPIDIPVVPGGPTAYFSSLPLKAIVQELHLQGVPASVSNTAGTYVCNHVFYALMHFASQHPGLRSAGFVHIPYMPEQAVRHPGQPSMSLSQVMLGLRLIAETAVAVRQDVRMSAGTTH
ncbi:pyroglutamyl-peptidase I [Undibacterium curvum]|uniref:pyroglutamyl-peptidase I n=1 Tax=Undibacterium curvum TaxID=2762294 RepID=UPI003D1370E1